MKTDGKLCKLPTGEWAIQVLGREPVRIVAGEIFQVEVAGTLKRARMERRPNGEWYAVQGYTLRAGFFDQREWYVKILSD